MKKLFTTIILVGFIFSLNGNISYAKEIRKETVIENATSPLFSPDGKSFAYTVFGDNDGKSFIIKDGVQIGKEGDYDISGKEYSSDSKGFVYVARRNGKEFVVKDGIERSEFDNVYIIRYLTDSKGFVYEARFGEVGRYIIIDGKEYSNFGGYVFSEDFNHFAYVADGKLIKDGEEIGKEYVGFSNPMFLSNGNSFVYVAYKDGKYYIIKDGQVVGAENNEIINLTFSPDGNSFIYSAKRDWKVFVVKDGVEIGKEYDSVDNLIYSPDGNSFSYFVEKNKKSIIIKDGEEIGKEYDGVYKPFYSLDGNSFIYEAYKGWKHFVVKDGLEIGKEYDNVYNPKYSSDGKSIIYSAEKDRKIFVIKDGEVIGDKYEKGGDGPIYSSDGKKIAIVSIKEGKHIIILLELVEELNTIKGIYTKQMILSKGRLNKTAIGKDYIKSIDILISKQSKEKLEIILKNITRIKLKISEKTNNKYIDVLNYLEAKIYLELNK